MAIAQMKKEVPKLKYLTKQDPELAKLINQEQNRQLTTINLIPSENYTSPAVREAVGSSLMHKYSEGNIGQRYYEGNEFIDQIETLGILRARKAFNLPEDWDVNLQALSGSNANLSVYLALLEPGDTIMGMYLPDGGHLSHGWSYSPKGKVQKLGTKIDAKGASESIVYEGGTRKVNVTSKFFKTIQYKTDPKTQLFNYAEVEKVALKYRPKLIISGGTAYPRNIDYKRMRKIADKVGAYYLADIAHEAGLIAAGVLPSPVGIADVVTMTTHKTFRGARGAIILSNSEIIQKVNKAILPGLQGGPFNNNIAGITAALGEILDSKFKKYAQRVLDNAQTLATALEKEGFTLVSGGTDKHLILIDLTKGPAKEPKLFGKFFARALALGGIIANMNTMPQESRSPINPSALRIGTPFVTTQGMGAKEMRALAGLIRTIYDISEKYNRLKFTEFEKAIAKDKEIKGIKMKVREFISKFTS